MTLLLSRHPARLGAELEVQRGTLGRLDAWTLGRLDSFAAAEKYQRRPHYKTLSIASSFSTRRADQVSTTQALIIPVSPSPRCEQWSGSLTKFTPCARQPARTTMHKHGTAAVRGSAPARSVSTPTSLSSSTPKPRAIWECCSPALQAHVGSSPGVAADCLSVRQSRE